MGDLKPSVLEKKGSGHLRGAQETGHTRGAGGLTQSPSGWVGDGH